jgi:hypothetical protein
LSFDNTIVLLNSHDGSSSYQMLAGCFRFVCSNGMVFGDTHSDIRVRHSGNILDNVIEGAFKVLEGFEQVDDVSTESSMPTARKKELRFIGSQCTVDHSNTWALVIPLISATLSLEYGSPWRGSRTASKTISRQVIGFLQGFSMAL